MDILGLGMSLIDSVQGVDAFPAASGVTEVRESVLMGGGPVPTALCAAARLGATTGIIDRVGDDWRGDLIAGDYRKFGVDHRYLIQEEGRTSSFGIILVRSCDGERHVIFQQGDASPLIADELPVEAIKDSRILHLNGRHWPACLDAARGARGAGGLISFDGGANRYDPKFRELFPLVDLLIVARDFAEKQAGTKDRQRQLESLASEGAQIVGVTDGVQGSWFRTAEGESFHQPAYEMEAIVDTTGCGDVFHGAFLFALTQGQRCREAAQTASAAAALSATALGGRGHLPSIEEVERLISQGKVMTHAS
ncbi:MAG: PfkB family carbohydrate kinase [Verrucomicrobiales bacterium]|nr:PfkB family carbohydrate kinase [Verrucomicrobiales bacterium]